MKYICVMMIALVMTGWAAVATADEVLGNPSFEDDGMIGDITSEEISYWDVNMMPELFGGWIDADLVTHGYYNLTLFSNSSVELVEGDIAKVYQNVDLYNVNQISFDVTLSIFGSGSWANNDCNAVIMIDDDVVWSQGNAGTYNGQTVNIDYDDHKKREVALALVIETDMLPVFYYMTDWDDFQTQASCNGNGFLQGDLDRDCDVDEDDLELLANQWLNELSDYHKCNLAHNDDCNSVAIINLNDYAQAINVEGETIPAIDGVTKAWLKNVKTWHKGYSSNYYTDDDEMIESIGIINFLDYSILSQNWQQNSL